MKANGYNINLWQKSEDKIKGIQGQQKLNFNGTFTAAVDAIDIANNLDRNFYIHEALAPFVTAVHEVCGHG